MWENRCSNSEGFILWSSSFWIQLRMPSWQSCYKEIQLAEKNCEITSLYPTNPGCSGSWINCPRLQLCCLWAVTVWACVELFEALRQLNWEMSCPQFPALPTQKCQLLCKTQTSTWVAELPSREPFWLSVNPSGVSASLCCISWALEKILQPNYLCPSTARNLLDQNFLLRISHFKNSISWSLGVFSKWPSSPFLYLYVGQLVA